jgi:hypothetical protein
MIITKKLQIVFKKMYPLMSGAIFESAHEQFFDERAHGKKSMSGLI